MIVTAKYGFNNKYIDVTDIVKNITGDFIVSHKLFTDPIINVKKRTNYIFFRWTSRKI